MTVTSRSNQIDTLVPPVVLTGLKKRYNDVVALDSVGLQVQSGHMVAVVGPDGAGKTTLLRTIAGITKPDEGDLRLFGESFHHRPKELKKRIGYLAQGFALYGDLSIDENIAFFARIYGTRDYRAQRERLLSVTRLTPFRKRLAARLSGGMKKKLALACSLVHKPDLIILDEPTTGVDPVSRRDFWLILGELLTQGMTIIVSTPYLDEAERCDQVGLLSHGRFLAHGSPSELKKNVVGDMVELVVPDSRRARAILLHATIPGLEEIQQQGDRLYLRGVTPARIDRTRIPWQEAVADTLRGEGIQPSSSRSTTPTLENVYISLLSMEAGS